MLPLPKGILGVSPTDFHETNDSFEHNEKSTKNEFQFEQQSTKNRYWASLGTSWGCLGSKTGAHRVQAGHLVAFWRSWAVLKASGERLGGVLGRLGRVSEASWVIMEAIFRVFTKLFEACRLGRFFLKIRHRFLLPTATEDFTKIEPPLQREHDFCKIAIRS